MILSHHPGSIVSGDRFAPSTNCAKSPLCQAFPDFLFPISHLYAILYLIALNSGNSTEIQYFVSWLLQTNAHSSAIL
ncbi:MAG: hypothetical protein HEQ35_13125 [Gloeotrichia echinulata IR180]